MKNMYRKIGKAKWFYACPSCGMSIMSVDEFGAYEFKQKHDKMHAFSLILKPVIEAFSEVVKGVGAAFKVISDVFAESAKNQPKYPTSEQVNRNRRKK